MNSKNPSAVRSQSTQLISLIIVLALFVTPLLAQQPTATPVRPAAERQVVPSAPEPTFDNLLGADSYKMYGEVRNLGQLMSTGGAGEIIDPIIKLANPPKEFKSIVKFLTTNSEALASSRLLFATWPARTEVPDVFVAIEFGTAEEAAKFAPKLESFLPSVLPPVPVEREEKSKDASAKPTESGEKPAAQTRKETAAGYNPASPLPAERLPFVITHSGSLVFISDKPFKFEKIHPATAKSLAEDQNFRVAHDRFSSEPVFIYFNVALEERSKPQRKNEVISEAERERLQQEEQAKAEAEIARVAASQPSPGEPQLVVENSNTEGRAVLTGAAAAPTPTPSQAQEAQMTASSQVGHMLDLLGVGEPQWPEAVGLALALDNNEYVIRAILVEPPNAKKLPLPFLPQLISGPAYTADAPSVLPDDTEAFVDASIDFAQTYEGMRKQADIKAKAAEIRAKNAQRQIPAGMKELPLDPFAEFEKKAGFKIKEDLLPALGNEIAIAGSLRSLQGAGGFNIVMTPSTKPASELGADKNDQKKALNSFPMLLIAVKDRDTAERLTPRVLDGLGIGEVNLIAQKERREDTELVNYAGIFAYAFVGNFLVISEAATVRHVIDANLSHQTLASNSAFRNSSRWQPRQNLGEIYVSPALMEAYQQEVRKQAATMDPAMRDFVMRLAPGSDAITYALSNDGLGTLHELHLPKNLIITMVAGISSTTKSPPPEMNEMIAISMLQMIASAEASYRSTAGNGSYGTLDKLVEQKLMTRETFEKYGYKFDLTVSGNQFEAVATPVEYGKTGKRSFFIDQSNVVRGDDHGGGLATIADKPVQ